MFENILHIKREPAMNLNNYIFLFGATAPPVGQGFLIHQVSTSHTTHHSR